jgi:Glyoxalase-like domain
MRPDARDMRIRQIVFAVRGLQAGSARLAALLGLDAPFRDPGVAEFGLDNAVFVFGDQFIELVAPLRDGTAAGRLLGRRGDSGYMLILQTDDFARARARCAALGVRTVFEAEFPDIRAVHLHPKDIGGAIVSVDEPRPAASWRWGGPDWQPQPGRRGAQRVVGVTIEANDPRAMAGRWAQVLGLAEPVASGAGFGLALEGGQVDFVAAGARGEGVAGFTLAVADLHAVLQSAQALGVPVQGDSLTLFGTRVELRGT